MLERIKKLDKPPLVVMVTANEGKAATSSTPRRWGWTVICSSRCGLSG